MPTTPLTNSFFILSLIFIFSFGLMIPLTVDAHDVRVSHDSEMGRDPQFKEGYEKILENHSLMKKSQSNLDQTLTNSPEYDIDLSIVGSIVNDPQLTQAYYHQIKDNYAYVVSDRSATLTTIDISDNESPVIVNVLQDKVRFAGAHQVFLKDDYLYVASGENGVPNGIAIVDITIRDSPQIISFITDPVALRSAHHVFVADNYAYISLVSADAMTILDISNKTSPVILSTLYAPSDLFNGAHRTELVGNTLFMVSSFAGSFVAIDVTDKENPTIIGSLQDISRLNGVHDLWVEGNYAYVVTEDSKSFATIDISDPTNLEIVGYLEDPTKLDGAEGIHLVDNHYAYVASYRSNSLSVVDISDPTTPIIVGYLEDSVILDGAITVKVVDNYAYVSSWESSGNIIVNSSFVIVEITENTEPTFGESLLRLNGLEDICFGWSVATTPDGNLLVGACRGDVGAESTGSAFLFDGTDGSLLLEINNPDPQPRDYFGWSVASTPNGDLLIGVMNDEHYAGSAFLFNGTLRGTTDTPLLTLNNPIPEENYMFGYSIATTPDGDLLVGSIDTAASATPEIGGSVFLFDGTDGHQKLRIDNPTPDYLDQFGTSVASTLDGNILVGAFTHGSNGSYAYLFDGTTGELLLTMGNPLDTTSTFDKTSTFGESVATTPDGNLLVSAPAYKWGTVYLFDGTLRGTTSTPLLTLNNPEPSVYDMFGLYIASTPDGNILVGGASDNSNDDISVVYLFDGITGERLFTINHPAFDSLGLGYGRPIASTPDGNLLMGDGMNDSAYLVALSGDSP